MKAVKLNLTLLLIPFITLLTASQCSASNSDSIVFENDSVFTIESVQKELSSEGEWIKVDKNEIDQEGVESNDLEDMDSDINPDWVWRPYNVEPGWSPYTNGYWVYSNCGWMWMSYYHWGWRTCHYGRWWWSPVWGWVWSPGFVWAPAWVVWLVNDEYCGWYPISPHIRWHHHWGWQCYNMRFHVRHWTFCHKRYYTSPINVTVIIDPPGNKHIIQNTHMVTGTNMENGSVVNHGPEFKEIEKATGQKIVTENVKRYSNVKEIISNEKENEIQARSEKQNYYEKNYNSEKQTGNEKKQTENNGKKQRNEEGYNNGEKSWNSGNEKQSGSKEKSNENVKKEKSYEQPKSYNPPEKKQSYDKPKDNNSGEKKQSYESPKKNDDSNNNGNKNDSQRNNDSPKDKSNGQDGGKKDNGNDNGKMRGK